MREEARLTTVPQPLMEERQTLAQYLGSAPVGAVATAAANPYGTAEDFALAHDASPLPTPPDNCVSCVLVGFSSLGFPDLETGFVQGGFCQLWLWFFSSSRLPPPSQHLEPPPPPDTSNPPFP